MRRIYSNNDDRETEPNSKPKYYFERSEFDCVLSCHTQNDDMTNKFYTEKFVLINQAANKGIVASMVYTLQSKDHLTLSTLVIIDRVMYGLDKRN